MRDVEKVPEEGYAVPISEIVLVEADMIVPVVVELLYEEIVPGPNPNPPEEGVDVQEEAPVGNAATGLVVDFDTVTLNVTDVEVPMIDEE
jgi:hypothetical protein